MCVIYFFFSSRRRHTRCALVTGVQTCALPICERGKNAKIEAISPTWVCRIPEHIIWAEVEGEFGVYPEACERTHGHDHTLGHTCGPGRINLDERRISADSSGRMVGAAGRDQVMEAKVPRLGAREIGREAWRERVGKYVKI